MPEAANTQSIFDRIAQSMEYANSFDLGTVAMRRPPFEQFDQAQEARRTSRPPTTTRATASPMSGTTTPTPAAAAPTELPDDVDIWAGVPADALAGISLVEGCASGSPLVTGPERSVPMYDTGEHVLAGNDLYPDQLHVGRGAGVAFSYGQVIAMGDFYETVDDLRNADPAELSRLKGLIERNTAYYRDGKRDRSADISNSQWNDATGGRYLALADDNYAHFSPPSVLGMTEATSEPDNKSTWERYHERAIAEMRALVAANPNASPAPYGPLTVNAFGDHFLTDAFAAGHLINKEVVLARVRSAFYVPGGNQLTSAGSAFLARLAEACWGRATVRNTFSDLELVETILMVHWNIDTENAFRKLLVGIAEREPGKVLNLALKALHDHLNRTGVEVTNDVGDPAWSLKGDGYLVGSGTLPIMQRAVRQSIDNILSPEILVSEAAQGPLSVSSHPTLLARVWQHVPRPTANGRAQVLAAIRDYTDLGSRTLLDAAAELIEEQSPLIARELVARRVLQHE